MLPSKLARGCGSSRLGRRSVAGVLVTAGFRLVCDLSSGPFLTSLDASCSKRDFRELTDDRVESSTDSVLSIVAGRPDALYLSLLFPQW